ncbi:MAG: hypothetical protein AAF652_12395 [Cyanobacteria bacterium P01_C01_bin.72]
MKRDNLAMEDDLRPEYDLKQLRVRRMGIERKNFANQTIRLEPDVAKVFPNADSVNEALRFLIRITQQNQEFIPETKADK